MLMLPRFGAWKVCQNQDGLLDLVCSKLCSLNAMSLWPSGWFSWPGYKVDLALIPRLVCNAVLQPRGGGCRDGLTGTHTRWMHTSIRSLILPLTGLFCMAGNLHGSIYKFDVSMSITTLYPKPRREPQLMDWIQISRGAMWYGNYTESKYFHIFSSPPPWKFQGGVYGGVKRSSDFENWGMIGDVKGMESWHMDSSRTPPITSSTRADPRKLSTFPIDACGKLGHLESVA